jgi:hypothetical protein
MVRIAVSQLVNVGLTVNFETKSTPSGLCKFLSRIANENSLLLV